VYRLQSKDLNMTNDEFVYYLLLKQEWERFQKSLNEKIKSEQGLINEKFAQMNKLAQEIRAELEFE
jgi:hypothetical protein